MKTKKKKREKYIYAIYGPETQTTSSLYVISSFCHLKIYPEWNE